MTETGNQVPGVDEPRPDTLRFTDVKRRVNQGAFAAADQFELSSAQQPAPPAVMGPYAEP